MDFWKVQDHIGSALNELGEQPPARELSLVRTKLEEAEMWLQRWITNNVKPQQ